MLPSTVLHDIEQLPPVAQSQLIDFVEFLKSRYRVAPSSVQAVEQTFGVIHVQKSVSIEQMDEAIRQGGTL